MAIVVTKYADKPATGLVEFTCDKVSEVADLPTTEHGGKGNFASFKQTVPMGSTCIVGNEGGDLLVYKLFTFGWKKF